MKREFYSPVLNEW